MRFKTKILIAFILSIFIGSVSAKYFVKKVGYNSVGEYAKHIYKPGAAAKKTTNKKDLK